eukprot:PhM_4_TR7501/c0_g1_i1/m.86522
MSASAPSTPTQQDSNETSSVDVLICSTCQNFMCTFNDIICDRAATWDEQVYAYEMDIETDKNSALSAWCYSATNPSARRFDVVRVKLEESSLPLQLTGKPSAEHSWFPPYKWRMCQCASCHTHMGWGFVDDNDNVVFAGLILTGTAPRAWTQEQLDTSKREARARAAAAQSYFTCRRKLIRLLREMPDQLAANQIGMAVLHMDNDPTMRNQIRGIYDFLMHQRQQTGGEMVENNDDEFSASDTNDDDDDDDEDEGDEDEFDGENDWETD